MGKLNIIKHKAMRTTDRICKNNKILFITVNPKIACKTKSTDHLWLPFLDQLQ